MSTDLREQVRERYAEAALGLANGNGCGCDCEGIGCCGDEPTTLFGKGLYEQGERAGLPADAVSASLGCGNPLAVADLHEGETVLDLGSGGGIDVLLSAQARRAEGNGVRAGHDERDARARAPERPGRQARRTSTSSRA